MLGAAAHIRKPFERVIQGVHRQTIVYDLTPAILRVCETLLAEGLEILYTENEWCALKWDGIGRLKTDLEWIC